MTIVKNITGSNLMSNSGIAHRIVTETVAFNPVATPLDFPVCAYEEKYYELVFNTDVPNLNESDSSTFTSRYFDSGVGDFFLISTTITGGEVILPKTETQKDGYTYVTTRIQWSDYDNGDFKVEFRFANFGAVSNETIEYHSFKSVAYNEERADGTLLLSFENIGQFDNVEFGYNSTNSPITENYNFRINGSIIAINPNQEKETFLTSTNQTKMRQVTIFNSYEFEFDLLPAKVINRLYAMMLEGVTEVFDYNLFRFNQNKSSSYKVVLNDSDLTVFSENTNGKLKLEAEDKDKSFKKRFRR